MCDMFQELFNSKQLSLVKSGEIKHREETNIRENSSRV